MKKRLFFALMLLLGIFPAYSQEIFEENGQYGIREDEITVIVPAVHAQIIQLSNGDFLLVRKNLAFQTAVATHTFEETAGLYDDHADTVPAFPFKKELLYGYAFFGGKPSYIPASYQAIYLRHENDDIAQAFDGKLFKIYDLWKGKWSKVWSEERMMNIIPENTESDLLFRQLGKYGLITPYFSIRAKPKYTSAKIIDTNNTNYVLFSDAKGQYLIGAEGGLMWKKPFQGIKVMGDNETAAAKQNGLWGFLGMYAKDFYMAPQFDEVMAVMNEEETTNYVLVQRKGKWGIYAVGDDSLLVPTEYERISYKGDNVFELIKDGKSTDWKQ